MSELKFQCPACGQKIAVDAKNAGRKTTCPSCKSPLTIPKSGARDSKKASQPVSAPRPQPAPSPPAAQRPAAGRAEAPGAAAAQPKPNAVRLKSGPAANAPEPAAAAPKAPQAAKGQPAPAGAERAPRQVPTLTTEVKLEIIRAVRDQIADEARWMPGRTAPDKFAYAAKRSGKTFEPVPVGDPAATHYSLWGAVLLEFKRRNVTRTATGRTEFLDQEIPDAINQVLGRPPASDDAVVPAAEAERLAITHSQCLRTLDLLEKSYQQRHRVEVESPVSAEIKGATVDELLTRVAKDDMVTSAEVLRAVHRELQSLEQRVSELEKSANTATS